MKYSTLILVLLTALSCSPGKPKSKTKTRSDSMVADMERTMKKLDSLSNPEPRKGWIYREEEDKMTSMKNRYAEVDAKDKLQFPFPYDGGAIATLRLRHKDGENNVMLTVSEGQFKSTSYDGMDIRVRFDNEQPIKFHCSESSSGSSKIIFINSEAKFIAKLKKASRVLIEAEFYNVGKETMEFDVAGLDWNY